MRPRRVLRAGAVCGGVWSADVHRETGMLGTGGAVQRGKARMDGRNRGMPECGGNLHRMHDAGIPGQVHAVHEPATGVATFIGGGDDVWAGDSCAAAVYAGFTE